MDGVISDTERIFITKLAYRFYGVVPDGFLPVRHAYSQVGGINFFIPPPQMGQLVGMVLLQGGDGKTMCVYRHDMYVALCN